MSNPNKKVFQYHGPYRAECYNKFFNPNICHVCKSVDKDNLILCERCCLISYCSEEHKMIHRPYHEKICASIVKVLQMEPREDTGKFENWQKWIQTRQELLESIQTELDDKIKPYEEQMILWSKSCCVCYQQTGLQICQRCFSANYCDEHANAFHITHDANECDRSVLLLNIDIETIAGNTIDISYRFVKFANRLSRFEDMLEFCMKYVLMRRRHWDWIAKDYVLSDYLSGPLTVFSGYTKVGKRFLLQKSHIVIHIIAPSSIERDGLRAWEVLLHLIPQIKSLTFIMIGTELENYNGEYSLCQSCEGQTKTIFYFSVNMLYHDFVESSKFVPPDMILAFHVEFDQLDMCAESINQMENQLCFIFLSSVIKRREGDILLNLEATVDRNITPYFRGRNVFCSLAPHRDFKNGGTYFYNEYLIVF